MSLIIKHKRNFYRRFKVDIWGLSFTSVDAVYWRFFLNWYLKFFFKSYLKKIKNFWKSKKRYIYRIDKIEIFKKRKKFKKRWVSIRLTKLHFIVIKQRQFRKFFRKAQRLFGNVEATFYYMLECRAINYLYRTNFVPDLFTSIEVIKRKWMYANFIKFKSIHHLLEIGGFSTCIKKKIGYLRRWLKRRIFLHAILFNVPRFIFVCFLFFFNVLVKKPRKFDCVYPIYLDAQRITGFC